ncbi:MAG: formate-dependent phosphoribosylglycinamide formyltransferase [Chitinophagaceae bacterium]|nr:formate-dependent phosphoribosylglycinamide formyltransferase [Oligoflexus sp.]
MSIAIGTPLKNKALRVLLLGSGELGKELTMELMKLGAEVIACDRYANAPAMQVAHRSHVFDMLDPSALEAVIRHEKPFLIVPEVEAIATDKLIAMEKEGFTVIPTAEATRLTMDREGIRRLASEALELPTARYEFADTYEELVTAGETLGFPLVIKPLMSSSGKGQSVARTPADLAASWTLSQEAGRAGAGRVIAEEFIAFDSEITLLTIRTHDQTLFCDPIGHKQKDGDYIESWQPHPMTDKQLNEAKHIAQRICDRLGGRGLFGVELFLLKDGRVLFSEVSPRPHDTGLVTLFTQTWSEFALHARAILGLPIANIHRHSLGASAAVKATQSFENPVFSGIEDVLLTPGVDLRIFGKPIATKGRRMAVCLATGDTIEGALTKAIHARDTLTIAEG